MFFKPYLQTLAVVSLAFSALNTHAQDVDSTLSKKQVLYVKTYPAKDFDFRVYGEVNIDTHFRHLGEKTWNYVDSSCSVDSIRIFKKKYQQYLQTIVPDNNGCWCNNQPVTIEDMNFDTHEDISLIQFTGSANTPYFFWLYDIKAKKFLRNEALEHVSSPVFDHKIKLVRSDWRSGAGNAGISTYQYLNGQLTKIKEVEEVSERDEKTGEDYFYVITRVRKNGVMKVISKTRYKDWQEFK